MMFVAKQNQIRWMIVVFISVNVMAIVPPSVLWSIASRMLTQVFIPLADLLPDRRPIRDIWKTASPISVMNIIRPAVREAILGDALGFVMFSPEVIFLSCVCGSQFRPDLFGKMRSRPNLANLLPYLGSMMPPNPIQIDLVGTFLAPLRPEPRQRLSAIHTDGPR
jgi:hypothetical protein